MIRNNLSRAATLLATALVGLLQVTSAHALSNRTFVSSTGNDANACTVAAPCRTLQAAFNVTAPGGEIQALDPTGYGTLNITHSIDIEGHGWASMNAAAGATVISVNASAGDIVVLRGLILEGNGTGGGGISFNTGGTLDVEDCVIRNFNGGALSVSPTTPAKLFVIRTHIFNNESGIELQANSGTSVFGVLRHISSESNASDGVGTDAGNGTVHLSVIDSELSYNGSGLFSSSSAGSTVVGNSTITGNVNGVVSNNGSNDIVRISRSTIMGNQNGFVALNGGLIQSYGDNNLLRNGSDGAPTSTIPYH